MAMSGGSGNNNLPMSDINVTPLVDVMLVLLIIFMVAAPHLEQGVPINLPQATVTPLPTSTDEIIVSIDVKGRVFIGNHQYPIDQIKDEIKRQVPDPTKQVFLRADKTVPYQDVITVMAELQKAGITNLGIVTEPEEVKGP